MKAKLLLLLLLWTGVVLGQEKNITGHHYVTKVDVPVIGFNIKNKKLKKTASDSLIAKTDTKFTAIEIVEDKIVIKFWEFKPESVGSNSSSSDSFIDLATSKDKYFVMELKDFDSKVEPMNGSTNSFTWGVTIIPVKLRFGNNRNRFFNYSESFSLGLNAGYEYTFANRKNQSISVLAGIAVSTVPVNPNDHEELVNTTTVGAFTPSFGVVYSFEQFQVGVFTGIDYLSGNLGSSWIYRDKPWLGLGLGFSIFQKNKKEDNSTQRQ